ncbi:MAG: 3-deoxy-8-phosphooctulonate synthase [Alphaproteobacteria bacterium]|jgi:2-dehydro-3-deoxyphosphooctonate aldolase (KDO 8-P synthase)|nr:3-deoxy-8-phosphooctulonate synthase [Alphaproteobacteria bacterium]
MHAVTIGSGALQPVVFNQTAPLALIAGTCALESRETTLRTAETLAKLCQNLGLGLVYKGSFDKANRTSASGARGLGLEEGLRVLEDVRRNLGLPVLTDVHETIQVPAVAEVADVLQIPAFLARQTDLLVACGQAVAGQPGKAVNIKKGQFMAPADMGPAAKKISGTGCQAILLTERGTTFGYGDLVVDYRGFPIMAQTGWPVVFDITHSIMRPSGKGESSTGDRSFAAPLARAAVAVGVGGLFAETHPNPANAISDRDTQLPLAELADFLRPLVALDRAVKGL